MNATRKGLVKNTPQRNGTARGLGWEGVRATVYHRDQPKTLRIMGVEDDA